MRLMLAFGLLVVAACGGGTAGPSASAFAGSWSGTRTIYSSTGQQLASSGWSFAIEARDGRVQFANGPAGPVVDERTFALDRYAFEPGYAPGGGPGSAPCLLARTIESGSGVLGPRDTLSVRVTETGGCVGVWEETVLSVYEMTRAAQSPGGL